MLEEMREDSKYNFFKVIKIFALLLFGDIYHTKIALEKVD